ncbi:MAG: C39 family peptidase [Anaerolineae bacterium]
MRRAHTVRLLGVILGILVLSLAVMPAWANPADDDSMPKEVTPRSAPAAYSLGQLKHSVQTLNNCGPASVVAVLDYYGFDVSQGEARQVLRPYADSRGMGWQVIAPYVAKFGLETKARINGNDDIIKALVANDIPVIVLQNVSETYRVGHYRVVQGYDDNAGVFYADDSLLGSNIAIPYSSFDARWEGLNYSWNRYIPIYRPDQAPLVAAILGADYTDIGMYSRVLPDLQAAVKANPSDRMAWSRLVEALTGAERYQEALTALDNSPTAGRGPSGFGDRGFSGAPNSSLRLKLLNKVGRYQEALDGADSALARSNGAVGGFGGSGTASIWLQKAEALRGLGQIEDARAAYRQALKLDKSLVEAADRLASLDS